MTVSLFKNKTSYSFQNMDWQWYPKFEFWLTHPKSSNWCFSLKYIELWGSLLWSFVNRLLDEKNKLLVALNKFSNL